MNCLVFGAEIQTQDPLNMSLLPWPLNQGGLLSLIDVVNVDSLIKQASIAIVLQKFIIIDWLMKLNMVLNIDPATRFFHVQKSISFCIAAPSFTFDSTTSSFFLFLPRPSPAFFRKPFSIFLTFFAQHKKWRTTRFRDQNHFPSFLKPKPNPGIYLINVAFTQTAKSK